MLREIASMVECSPKPTKKKETGNRINLSAELLPYADKAGTFLFALRCARKGEKNLPANISSRQGNQGYDIVNPLSSPNLPSSSLSYGWSTFVQFTSFRIHLFDLLKVLGPLLQGNKVLCRYKHPPTLLLSYLVSVLFIPSFLLSFLYGCSECLCCLASFSFFLS